MSSPTEIRTDSTENLLLLLDPATSSFDLSGDAEGNKNRIPLARCSQQAVISTPGASISIEEPHMTVSTDEDTEHIAVNINPSNPNVGDSLRSINDLESGSQPHPLVPFVSPQNVPSSDGLTCRHK